MSVFEESSLHCDVLIMSLPESFQLYCDFSRQNVFLPYLYPKGQGKAQRPLLHGTERNVRKGIKDTKEKMVSFWPGRQ